MKHSKLKHAYFRKPKYLAHKLYIKIIFGIVLIVSLSILGQQIYKPKHLIFRIAENVQKEVIIVSQGDNLFSLLTPYQLSYSEIKSIVNIAKPYINLEEIKKGQKINIYSSKRNERNFLDSIRVFLTFDTVVEIKRDGKGDFISKELSVPLIKDYSFFRGQVDSSLLNAAIAVSAPYKNVIDIINTYSHQIDFQRDIQKGDEFVFIIEKLTDPEDKTIQYGKTIYASLKNNNNLNKIYLYSFEDGTSEYFNDNFTSVRKPLIKTPVQATRVSSEFGIRKHPVLGFSKMHTGVDFAAPMGTPIYAAGTGTITQIGWKGGYGRYIKIQHSTKISTAYAHLLSFSKGIKKGVKVAQGQIIGKVGASGRATGPHLHYEVHINNKHVNPMNIHLAPIKTIAGKDKERFIKLKEKINSILKESI